MKHGIDNQKNNNSEPLSRGDQHEPEIDRPGPQHAGTTGMQSAPGTAGREAPKHVAEEHHRAAMKAAQEKLKGILLPPTFAGFSVAFEAALPQFERPKNNCWFQVHPEVYFDVFTFKGQDSKALYVALSTDTELVSFLASRNAGRPTRCYPYIYNDGTVGFWPVSLDGTNGRQLDTWNKSAHLIAEESKGSWRAIVPGKDCYRTASAPVGHLYGKPQFPEDLTEQFSRVIQGVLVENLDHPEMKRWQGLQ